MPFLNSENLDQREPMQGFVGRFAHGSKMTVVHWVVKADSLLPTHSHPNEQITNVIKGEFELTIDRETKRLGPGSIAIIPSDAVHSGKAITECRIIEVFAPVREDYK